jgi:hypothetical protein
VEARLIETGLLHKGTWRDFVLLRVATFG